MTSTRAEHHAERARIREKHEEELTIQKEEHQRQLASMSAALAAIQARLKAADAHNRQLQDAVRNPAADCL